MLLNISVQIKRFKISIRILKIQTWKLGFSYNHFKQKLLREWRELDWTWKIRPQFSITQVKTGKTAAATIKRNGKKLRKEHDFFKSNCKTRHIRQFMVIQETLYKWFGKCCAARIYPFRSMLQEEIRNHQWFFLPSFNAFYGCLEKWNSCYGIWETFILGNRWYLCL